MIVRGYMKLYIPELGSVITLTKDWTFTVCNESRNRTLAAFMGISSISPRYPLGATHGEPIVCSRSSTGTDKWERVEYPTYRPRSTTCKFIWAKGTKLTVDRIYIRKGNEDYSSLTFKTKVGNKVIRFFAKLADVNNIECNVVE